jgi:hypothetical protein
MSFTKKHIALFKALRDPAYENFVMAEIEWDGETTSAIGTEDKDGNFTPLAVLLTPEMIADFADGDEDDDSEETGAAPGKRYKP